MKSKIPAEMRNSKSVRKGREVLDTRVDVDKLKTFVVAVLQQVGVDSPDARIAAEVLVRTDMRGVRTHGTRQLKTYVTQIVRGGINPKAKLRVLVEGPTWAMLDGCAGLGVVVAYKSMKLAMAKARESVVGIAGARNSNHCGAVGYYASVCLEENMVGLAMTNADPTMSAPGSAARVLGTNPIACAFPAGEENPILLDIATSVVAGVKIHQAAKEGRRVPEGWIVNRNGAPTTDPRDLQQGGAHVPFGGHKGFGLALMVEILSGVMTGAGVADEVTSLVEQPDKPSNVGHFFLAVDIGAITPINRFKARMDRCISKVRSCPKAVGVNRIYLPGVMEAEEEERAKTHGVLLDEPTLESLRQLGQDLGIKDQKIWKDLKIETGSGVRPGVRGDK